MTDFKDVTLPQGTIRYRDTGAGPPLVFVHGLLVDGTLWDKVVPRLERDFRCIVPDLPLGSHRVPLKPDADRTPPGVAKLIADFLAALDLEDVTLVGNDTGGALCQMVCADHPQRIGRLVLTPCDAYENFLPPAFRGIQYAAKVPGVLAAILQGLRIGAIRKSPLGFGLLLTDPDPDLLERWSRPLLENPAVRRDATRFLAAIDKRQTLDAAEKLKRFDRPTLIAWAPGDRLFKLKYAERLAADIPDARLERVENSRTFVPHDQPERLAELIAAFAREPRAEAAEAAKR
jgi:pimeloyl-ACP methyl ester carboxylesterase